MGHHIFWSRRCGALALSEANACRENRVLPQEETFDTTQLSTNARKANMPSEADVRQDKQATAQARQVIDIFHEISTLLVSDSFSWSLPRPLLTLLRTRTLTGRLSPSAYR